MNAATNLRKRLMIPIMASAALSVGCAEEPSESDSERVAQSESTAPEQDSAKQDDQTNETSLSPVFPDSLAKGFSHDANQPLEGGGMAGVGMICRGSGADVAYVGVKGANALADGTYKVRMQPGNTTLQFQTGTPDSGVGAGAGQSSFDEAQYTFTFEELDFELTVPGC